MSAVIVRAPRRNEAAGLARLINAVSQADYGLDDLDEAEIGRWFEQPDLDPERDMFVVEEGGELVAYGDVANVSGRNEQVWIDLRLPRTASGEAAAALLNATERRTQEMIEAAGRPMKVVTGTWSVNERLLGLLQRRGYRRSHGNYRMAIELGGIRAEPSFPEGIEVRPFRPEHARAVFEAYDESFRDLRDYVADTFEAFEVHFLGREEHDPKLWVLAWDGEELAGVALCRIDRIQHGVGFVSVLGVRRPWRRRGLGRALLLEAFRRFGERGFSRVELGVDAASLTGAHVLYESVGMHVVRHFDEYER